MSTLLRLLGGLLLVIPLLVFMRPVLGQSGKAVTMQGTVKPRTPEVREALIIAHQNYSVMVEGVRRKSGVLTLPIADGMRIKAALEAAGFHVTLVTDLPDYAAIERALNAFVDRVRERHSVVFVYYTGHAAGLDLEEGPETYLIPVQLEKPKSDRYLANQSYPLSTVVRKLRNAGTRLELVVIDACRNNPFLDDVPVARKRLLTKGIPRARLAPKDLDELIGDPDLLPATGTIIYYAAQEGDTTNDDGIYAQAWEKVIRTPGLNLHSIPSRLNALLRVAGRGFADARPVYSGQFHFVEPLIPNPTPLQENPYEVRSRSVGLIWHLLVKGRYSMGSTDGDSDEKPRRTVTVPAVQMSSTEVTNAQYLACVAAGECDAPSWDDGKCRVWTGTEWKEGKLPYSFRGDNQPVVCVDWNQAKAFAAWVGGRLASEAEWEYAATGGGKMKYAGTDDLSSVCQYGNVADQTAKKANPSWTIVDCNDGYSETAPVGQFKDGAWGLKDMTGNVWEWVEDCYENYSAVAPDTGAARTRCSGSSRVVRGGGWGNDGQRLRAANRYWRDPANRDNGVGFRVVRSVSRAGSP